MVPCRAVQVLPLSLSVDFLRLVLAVVDDHARSQGQAKVKTPAATAAAATATTADDALPLSPGTSPAASEKIGTALSEEGDAKVQEDVGAPPPVHANAACFLSVGDLPRLYNRPGAIVRNLFKACKGDKPSGEVRVREGKERKGGPQDVFHCILMPSLVDFEGPVLPPSLFPSFHPSPTAPSRKSMEDFGAR